MKKWALPLAAAALIAVIAVVGAAFALTDSGDGGGSRLSRDADDREGGGEDTDDGIDAICLEGAVDCDDTIDTPTDPDVCIQIFPTPPECADPDAPVSDEPPPADEPGSGNGGAGFRTCLDLTEHNTLSCGQAATALATQDLAQRLGSADGIALKSFERVDWPDSCLGVYQPDVACAAVVSPGYRVILEANGQTYEYHTQGLSRVVLVE
jgi:hypothetical protein